MKRRPKSICLMALVLLLAGGETWAWQQENEQPHPRGDRSSGRGRMREDNGLKVGEMAPVFKLKSLDGKQETDLASFQGKRPVILFFGSYT